MRCDCLALLAFLVLCITSIADVSTAFVKDDDAAETLVSAGEESRQACLLQLGKKKAPVERNMPKKSHQRHPRKTLVEIYYESKCPFSMDFINTTLREAWHDAELRESMEIKLYPFGNAVYYNKTMVSRGYHFWHPREKFPMMICQHGEPECLGNRIQACAVDILKESSKYVPFVLCVASFGANAGAELSSYECGKRAGLDMRKVKECVHSKNGLDLMMSLGNATREINASHVPWVMVNGQHTKNDTLISPVCNLLRGPKPKACPTPRRKGDKEPEKEHGGSGPCLFSRKLDTFGSTQPL